MKVCVASTCPPRQCGIATYTRKLATAMADLGGELDLAVLAEDGGARFDDRIGCVEAFARRTAYRSRLPDAASGAHADLVHFQHAPDIFGVGGELVATLRELARRRTGTVVTLHTVFTRASGLLERKPFVVGFHRRLARAAGRLVVHSRGSMDILLSHGVSPEKIAIIPHGTDPFQRGDAARGREILGLRDGERGILFFGFIHVQKNIQVVIRAMREVLAAQPRARFVIAGKIGSDAWYNRLYLDRLKRMIARLDLAGAVRVVDSFIPDDNVPDIHAAVDLMVLPHAQGYGSASGVVHNAMTMDVPMLCSDSIKFEEVGSRIAPELLVGAKDHGAWARMMVRLMADAAFRSEISRRSRAYAEETMWSEVAAKHAALYESILEEARR